MCPFFMPVPGYQYGTYASSGTSLPLLLAPSPMPSCRSWLALYGASAPRLTAVRPADSPRLRSPPAHPRALLALLLLCSWQMPQARQLAQMSLCLKSDASSWLEAWVLRKSGSNNMTGSECARALRGAWCRVLASCNSGSAPRRGSGCIELRASAVNVNSIRCSLKRLKSST